MNEVDFTAEHIRYKDIFVDLYFTLWICGDCRSRVFKNGTATWIFEAIYEIHATNFVLLLNIFVYFYFKWILETGRFLACIYTITLAKILLLRIHILFVFDFDPSIRRFLQKIDVWWWVRLLCRQLRRKSIAISIRAT